MVPYGIVPSDLLETETHIGTGRYESEHWVHSRLSIQACDVSTSNLLGSSGGHSRSSAVVNNTTRTDICRGILGDSSSTIPESNP